MYYYYLVLIPSLQAREKDDFIPVSFMEKPPANFNVLVIEDNPSDFYLLEQMLRSSRLAINNIHASESLTKGIELIREHEIGLVILDLSLPDSFGIDSFLKIRQFVQKIPVIILTGLSDFEVAREALNQNAQDYLIKGEFNASLLIKSIEYSIERKKAEEKVLASEEKYRQMFYKNPLPMWITETGNRCILEVNDAAIETYGYERDEFLQLNLEDIEIVLNGHQAGNANKEKLCAHRKKNGEYITVDLTYYPISYFGKTAMQTQVNDVTEKIRLENELNLQKQQLIEAVLTAQEYERKKIGVELHDNINQVLTAIKLNLGLALEMPDDSPQLISKSLNNVSVAIEEIRKLSKTFNSSGNLKELGLVDSIKELIRDYPGARSTHIQLDTEKLKQTALSEEQKVTIYRIVQEQLNNILKHADASSVVISLQATEDQIKLVIADNGKGYDPSLKKKGVGFTNMESRAELFNGKIKIDSTPGNGCRLEIVLNAKIHFPQEAQ